MPSPRPAARATTLRGRLDRRIGAAWLTAAEALTRRAARLRRRSVVVDGVPVPYLEGGSGRPTVLVHGYAADKETWLMLAPLLRRRRLVIPDLPGWGAAGDVPLDQYTYRAQGAALGEFLDRVGLTRVDVVGASMGGGIGLRLAHDRPDAVRSLALLGPTGPEVAQSELRWFLDSGHNRLVPRDEGDLADHTDFLVARPLRLPGAMKRYSAARLLAQRDSLLARFELIRHPMGPDGVPETLDRIRAPTLVLHGLADRVIHPATARELVRRLPRAELVLLPGVGHMPQLEAPAATAWRLRRFWRSLEQS